MQDNPTPSPSPSPDAKESDTGKQQANEEKKGINDLVTIKEAVNKEGVSPNGDKVRYIYQLPIINIDKPGAKLINDMFLGLEKDMENRIGNGQNMTLSIPSKAFLNDGIISIVMEIRKGGPGGIHAVNYDIKNDKEISTKELIEKFKFDPQKLIDQINMSKPGAGIDFFINTIIDYDLNDNLKNPEEILNKTKEEKEKCVLENINKIMAYINNDGKFLFIHRAELEDEELTVTETPVQTITPAATPKPGSGPGNLKDIKGFVPFENQSFMVDLNSWGNVKFVSGKLTAGTHIPTVFYLTDEAGNILYSFEDTPFPYSVDVKSVSFTDVNKDGLKDIIIIVVDAYQVSDGKPIAAVWLQNADGTFTCDTKLYQELNESGNNKDIKTVTNYLSKKF
jgi:hypothetical protein